MKTGRSLTELAQEIERQAKSKHDYIADTRAIRMAPDGNGLVVSEKPYGITDHASRQLGERLQIPAKYYERLRAQHPALLAENVNTLLHAGPEKRLVRVLDGNVRALMSDRYQRIDNIHIAEAVLPVLLQTPGIRVVSAEVTDRKLYIKAVNEQVRATVTTSRRVGDLVEAGVMISNSEVGLGAVSVDPFRNFLACLNGMVINKAGLRRAHIGTRLSGDDNIAELLADDTRVAEDRAVLLKVRDVVRAAMDAAQFFKWMEQLEATTSRKIEGNPVEVVELLAAEQQFNAGEKSSVLKYLIEGGDLSQYGLVNAVTRTAEDLPSYDRATEFEALGGRLVDLSASEWTRISEAA